MWIKYRGKLYNTDKCFAMFPSNRAGEYPSFILRYDEPLYSSADNDDQTDTSNYISFGDMTVAETEAVRDLIWDAFELGCRTLNLDTELPILLKQRGAGKETEDPGDDC